MGDADEQQDFVIEIIEATGQGFRMILTIQGRTTGAAASNPSQQ
jgi:hypothetical protein